MMTPAQRRKCTGQEPSRTLEPVLEEATPRRGLGCLSPTQLDLDQHPWEGDRCSEHHANRKQHPVARGSSQGRAAAGRMELREMNFTGIPV